MSTKSESRTKKKISIRKRVNGTASRPRLAVFRSVRHMYAQVIDDQRHVTLAYASTLEADVGVSVAKANKVEQAKRVGSLVAKRCLELGVTQVVFDRSGFVYHGRIAAVAQAARESGLAF